MGREIRKTRYLSEIGSMAELREARREFELREWYARERLEDDIHSTFSLDTLLSIVAPPGSLVGRVIGNVGMGITAAQGVIGVINSMMAGRAARKHTPAPAFCRSAAPRAAAHTTAKVATHTASRKTAGHAKATHPVSRKQTPEIEVEVELSPKKVPATGAKKR